jgi:hypothetical protein
LGISLIKTEEYLDRFMKNIFINISPQKALIINVILPFTLIVLSYGAGSITEHSFFYYVSVVILLLTFYFDLVRRLYLGFFSFKKTPFKSDRTRKYRVFIILSIINMVIIPLLILLFFVWVNRYPKILFFIPLIGIYAWISNYFQLNFIAENMSLIKYGGYRIKSLWPIDWITLLYFAFNVRKTQTIINDILK